MGGIGSGRFRRRLRLAEKTTRLDAKELVRVGTLQAGKRGIITWKDEKASSVGIETYEDRIVLQWQYQDCLEQKHVIELPIWWAWSECNFGGRRPWLICPKCQGRARFLYLSGGSIFACGKCAGITYATRRGSKIENAERKLNRIQGKLNDEGMKRGLYRKTRERIQGQLEVAEAKLETLREQALAKLAVKAKALWARVEEAERRMKIAKNG